jgi:hypothetical protein
MKIMLLAAAVAATAFTIPAKAQVRPDCHFAPEETRIVCERQEAILTAIYEDGQFTRDKIEDLEVIIKDLEVKIKKLEGKTKTTYP